MSHDPDRFHPPRAGLQEAFPPMPICWPALAPDEHDELLGALTDWVDWLSDRYGLDYRKVPPCWPEHGALVEELSALHTAWQTAYAHTSRADAPLEWHTHFAAARQRLTEWVSRSGCRPGEHRCGT